MSLESNLPGDDPAVLYAEKTMGGYAVLRENRTGQDSQIDIELLFNAAISHKEQMKEVFRKELTL
jgi:ABC-2 type transport system ATP-binding protein